MALGQLSVTSWAWLGPGRVGGALGIKKSSLTATPGTGVGAGSVAPLLHWEDVSTFFWSAVQPGFRIDPFGLPGGPAQTWFIESTGGVGLPWASNVPGEPSQVLSVDTSAFTVDYEALGNGSFKLRIADDNSHLRLAGLNGLELDLPLVRGLLFGTMQILPGAVSGLFDFTAIGLAGSWDHDIVRGYTAATVSRVGGFDASSLVLSSVPEPATGLLALAGVGVVALRRRAGAATPPVPPPA